MATTFKSWNTLPPKYWLQPLIALLFVTKPISAGENDSRAKRLCKNSILALVGFPKS